MRRFVGKLCLFLALPLLSSLASLSQAEDLTYYYLGDKGVSAKELSPAITQQLFEAELEKYQRTEQIVDSALLDQHLNGLAKKQNKTRAALEADMFKASVSEKDAETWFKENKAMLQGREFAAIKGEIIPYLTRMKQEKMKKDLLVTVKKEQKFRFALTKPIAPVLAINTEGFPRKGGKNPKVTIIEFADYGCPHCKVASGVLKKVVEKYPEKIALIFLDFPLHPGSPSVQVAEGGVCADEQGKFWPYHYEAFSEQGILTEASPTAIAKKIQLDMGKFTSCVQNPATKAKVATAKQEGERIGVSGTPAIYLNGKKQSGYSEQELLSEIERLM
jgi:protein-disulfide isomerase